jgi:hypothetical protein
VKLPVSTTDTKQRSKSRSRSGFGIAIKFPHRANKNTQFFAVQKP